MPCSNGTAAPSRRNRAPNKRASSSCRVLVRASTFGTAIFALGGLAVQSERAGADISLPPGFAAQVVAQGLPTPSYMRVAPAAFGGYGHNVFCTDYQGSRVLRIDQLGTVHAFAAASLNPLGVEFAPGGTWGAYLYVNCNQDPSSSTDGRVLRIDGSGNVSFFGRPNPAGGYANGGVGIAFSDTGAFGTNLYTGASGGAPGDCISRIPSSGGTAQLFYSVAGNCCPGTYYSGSPYALTFGPGTNGFGDNLYVSLVSTSAGQIKGIFTLDAGAALHSFAENQEASPPVWDMTFGPGGAFGDSLYVTAGTQIVTFDSSANPSVFASGLGSGATLTFDGTGILYVLNGGQLLEILPCPGPPTGDTNGDSVTDGADCTSFVAAALAHSTAPHDVCAADFDGNGRVDANDVPYFVARLLVP